VIYVIDTLRFDRVHARVAGEFVAPNLARLADEAIFYERAIATSSWTRPTVATLLTGLTPSEHRVQGLYDTLAPEAARLPRALAAAGHYSVALSSNPNILPKWGFSDGFDRFVDADVRVGDGRERGFERLLDTALDVVRKERDSPLFLFVHDNGPHIPYQAPARHRALFGAPPPGDPAEFLQHDHDAETLRKSQLL